MDSLSPESRALYEILMADTAEIYESKFAAYKKDRLDAVKQFVDDTRMCITDLQTTVDSVPGKMEIEVDSVKAALGEDLAAVKSALSSEISALAPDLAGFKPDTTVDDLSPGARRCYDYLVGTSANLDPVRKAVDMGAADLVVSAPTTCLVECPSHDADVPASVLIPSATPNSSTTTGGVIPELAAPEVSDKELDMDVTSNTAPAICLPGVPGHNTGGEDPVAMSLTHWSSTPSYNAPPANSPITVSAEFMSPAVGDLLKGGDTLTLQPPWPPPAYVNLCKDMPQALLLDGLVLQSMQLLCPGKYRCPPRRQEGCLGGATRPDEWSMIYAGLPLLVFLNA